MADLEKMSLVELRVAGRKMGVKNVTTYKKRELLELLLSIQERQSEETEENTEEKDEYRIHLCADTFVPFLELDFADADAVFGDNYLMLTEKKETVVTLKKEDITQGSFADAEDLKKRLVCRSVTDTY